MREQCWQPDQSYGLRSGTRHLNNYIYPPHMYVQMKLPQPPNNTTLSSSDRSLSVLQDLRLAWTVRAGSRVLVFVGSLLRNPELEP